MFLGALSHADSQASPAEHSAAAAPSITADFGASVAPLRENTSPWLRRCQAVFQDSIMNHPDIGYQFSPVVIAAGRQCLQQIGGGDALPASDWAFLLRFAIALNEDALVQRIVARQLSAVGRDVRDRAAVIEHVIKLLAHNTWPEVSPNAGLAPTHITAAHTILACQYAAQLDTMQPGAQLVITRLRVFDELVTLSDTTWNADTALAREQHRLQIARSFPLTQIPLEDQSAIRETISAEIYRIAELTYFAAPTHANLTKFVVTRDSLRGADMGETVDSLLGHPAPQLGGDYWFNTPAGGPVVVPQPGRISLLVFGLDPHDVEPLQRLHTRYPSLQIVLIEVTTGAFAGQNLYDDPDGEAAQIHHYLTDELRAPGVVCVLRTKYHSEPGMTAVPYASPVLDRFHLDPLTYKGHTMLVDAGGWVVQLQSVLDDHLLPRLAIQ
jgi:hypothetical protein